MMACGDLCHAILIGLFSFVLKVLWPLHVSFLKISFQEIIHWNPFFLSTKLSAISMVWYGHLILSFFLTCAC